METTTKKEKKSFPVLWIIILLLSIGLGLVGYFFFNLGKNFSIGISLTILALFLWAGTRK